MPGELLRANKPLPEDFDADMEEAIKRDYLSNPINIEVVNTIVSSRKLIKNYGEDLSIDQILTPDAKERYSNCLKFANELGAVRNKVLVLLKDLCQSFEVFL